MSNSNINNIEKFDELIESLNTSMDLVELAYLRLKQLDKNSSEFERMSTLNEFNRCVLMRDELSAKLEIFLKEIGVAS